MNPEVASLPDHAAHFPPLGRGVRALMVWPAFPNSFWSFRGSMPIFGKKAVLPPLGLVTVAALCPEYWSIKLVDQTVDELQDSDMQWADLIMVSGMEVQRDGMRDVLLRARHLGKRTIVGGPYASSQPLDLLPFADHVVAGEPDEVFDQIARELEEGTAKRLYQIHEKPDVGKSPIPRFDLLKSGSYLGMSVQFSRGCPFQCEFCDIITIYGRRPRTKSPAQLLAELDALRSLGGREAVFIVDDNFIGNRKRAHEMLVSLQSWQERYRYPFMFLTEASINLAQCPELIEAMVAANFANVFIGIESPSKESLTETKKLQNLREDLEQSIRHIQSHGLWVMGGFIVGFDSDDEHIFERQVRFITDTAIPFAMIGFLQALVTTPLYERLKNEGRLLDDVKMTHNFNLPNFRTKLPQLTMARGYRETLQALYNPSAYYERGFHSLLHWKTTPVQRPSDLSARTPAIVLRSLWHQGIRSSYRNAYWTFLWRILRHCIVSPPKLAMGFMILISGHHFISYAAEVVDHLDVEIRLLENEEEAPKEMVSV